MYLMISRVRLPEIDSQFADNEIYDNNNKND